MHVKFGNNNELNTVVSGHPQRREHPTDMSVYDILLQCVQPFLKVYIQSVLYIRRSFHSGAGRSGRPTFMIDFNFMTLTFHLTSGV